VETAFGVLASRLRLFLGVIDVDYAEMVVASAICLHNWLGADLREGEREGERAEERLDAAVPGTWTEAVRLREAKTLRDKLVSYLSERQ